MSEIRVDNITDEAGTGRPDFSNGIKTSNINGGQVGGRRNLIINGAMQVAQRGTSVTSNDSGYFVVDRFRQFLGSRSGDTTFDVTQDSDSPDVFDKSLKIAVNTIGDTAPVTNSQRIEGQNLAGLGTGTPNARTMALSFFVKSNVVGTYAIEFQARSETELYRYVGNYTIDESGIWEAKQIVVLPLTEISVRNTNDVGLRVEFWLNDNNGNFSGDNTALENWVDASTIDNSSRAAGQTATIGDSANDYWQITGVQLEVGDTATEFEHRSFGEELSLCQRYYSKISSVDCSAYSVSGENAPTFNFSYPQAMRATPTITINRQSNDSSNLSSIVQRNQTTDSFNLFLNRASTGMVSFGHNGNEANFEMDSEL